LVLFTLAHDARGSAFFVRRLIVAPFIFERMKTPTEEVESKILKHLRELPAAKSPKQIASFIQEPLDRTYAAINSLIKKRAVKSIPDFTLLDTTQESSAIILTDHDAA